MSPSDSGANESYAYPWYRCFRGRLNQSLSESPLGRRARGEGSLGRPEEGSPLKTADGSARHRGSRRTPPLSQRGHSPRLRARSNRPQRWGSCGGGVALTDGSVGAFSGRGGSETGAGVGQPARIDDDIGTFHRDVARGATTTAPRSGWSPTRERHDRSPPARGRTAGTRRRRAISIRCAGLPVERRRRPTGAPR